MRATFAALLLAVAAMLATCGDNGPDGEPGEDDVCLWDATNWNECRWQ